MIRNPSALPRIVLLLALLVSLSGCIGPLVPVVRIDEDSRLRLNAQVQVYRVAEPINGQVTRLGPATTTSCKNQLTDPAPTEADAIGQLRYRATQAGGNAVVDAICESQGTSLTTNCWSSVTCQGTIARIEPKGQRQPNASNGSNPRRGDGSGSGFFINSAGVAITNHHVVEGCSSIRTTAAGAEYPAKLIAADESNDLALIQVDVKQPSKFLSFRSTPARLAEPIAALGYPLPGVLSPSIGVSTGTVSSLSGIRGDSRFVQVNTPVQPGNSGGPVIDDRGLVIGVVVSKLDALKVVRATGDIPQNVNFAIGLRSIQTFLESQNTKYVVEADGTRDISAASERASMSTVRVICGATD